MKIIVEGHEIDTLDIWDIKHIENTREVWVIVCVKDKPDVKIGRRIPYETYSHEFQEYWRPYKKLYKKLKEQWESDKNQIPVFKL